MRPQHSNPTVISANRMPWLRACQDKNQATLCRDNCNIDVVIIRNNSGNTRPLQSMIWKVLASHRITAITTFICWPLCPVHCRICLIWIRCCQQPDLNRSLWTTSRSLPKHQERSITLIEIALRISAKSVGYTLFLNERFVKMTNHIVDFKKASSRVVYQYPPRNLKFGE